MLKYFPVCYLPRTVWLPRWLGGKEGDVRDPGSILGQEDPLEKEMATHSSIFAWEIPWMEEPGGLQCMGSDPARWPSTQKHVYSPCHPLLGHCPKAPFDPAAEEVLLVLQSERLGLSKSHMLKSSQWWSFSEVGPWGLLPSQGFIMNREWDWGSYLERSLTFLTGTSGEPSLFHAGNRRSDTVIKYVCPLWATQTLEFHHSSPDRLRHLSGTEHR